MAGTGYNVADQHRLFVFPADCVDYRLLDTWQSLQSAFYFR